MRMLNALANRIVSVEQFAIELRDNLVPVALDRVEATEQRPRDPHNKHGGNRDARDAHSIRPVCRKFFLNRRASLPGILGSKRAAPEAFQNAHMLVFTGLRYATEESCRLISAMGRFVFVWFQYVNEKHALLTVFDWGGFRENPRRGRYTKFSIGPKHFAPPKSGRIDAGGISRKSGPALEIPSKIGKRIVESLFSSPMPIKTGFELFLGSALRQNFLISPRVGDQRVVSRTLTCE